MKIYFFFSLDFLKQKIIITYKSINKISGEVITILLIINIIFIILLSKRNDSLIESINNTSDNCLYDLFKYPQISIIMPNVEELNVCNESIFNLITSLQNQTLKNIQILLSFSKKEYLNYYNELKKDLRLQIYFKLNLSLIEDIYYLVSKSKGKYIMIIDKYEILYNNEIEKFYNFTKGKVNNIYIFRSTKGNYLYLIKSKIIKNLIEDNLFFNNISNLYNYLLLNNEPKLNYISIAFCPDNYYTAYTYVAMMSILNSKFYYTYISFYLIINNEFEQKNIDFLSSLYDQYDLFNITFINMNDRYNVAYVSRYLTKQTYYRFSLGELLPYLNKIIYLDTDIIVYNDLSELFSLNFNNKLILAQPTYYNKSKKTGIFKINNGILLFNLNEMRKLKIEKKVLYILNNGFKNELHDQFLLNQYFYECVGLFSPKFHIRPWRHYNEMIQFNKDSGNLYDKDFLYFSFKHPTIVHFVYNTKPIYENNSYSEDWWYFARKSKYFSQKSTNLTSIFNFTYE